MSLRRKCSMSINTRRQIFSSRNSNAIHKLLTTTQIYSVKQQVRKIHSKSLLTQPNYARTITRSCPPRPHPFFMTTQVVHHAQSRASQPASAFLSFLTQSQRAVPGLSARLCLPVLLDTKWRTSTQTGLTPSLTISRIWLDVYASALRHYLRNQ